MGNSCQRDQRLANAVRQEQSELQMEQVNNRAQKPGRSNRRENSKKTSVKEVSQPKQPSYFNMNNPPLQQPIQQQKPKQPERPVKAIVYKKECIMIDNYGNPCNHYECPPLFRFVEQPISAPQPQNNANFVQYSGIKIHQPSQFQHYQ